MYAALSRVTSLNGLFLTGEYKSSDSKATIEYERMRSESVLEPLLYNTNTTSDATLTVTLLNTRSLHRHAIDISHDRVILNTDVLCLTETQLLPNYPTNNIPEILSNFAYLHNNSNDKYQSITFCYKAHVEIVNHHYSTGISIVEFKKTSFSPDPIVIVYRKNDSCLTTFYHTISEILQLDTIQVVLGDFNINAQDPIQVDRLSKIFQNYKQIVEDSTHFGGTILDHIYIKKDFQENVNLEYFVKTVYILF